MDKREIGTAGEKAACQYLKRNRYKILERNFRRPFGELDLIASQGDTVVFIEVKTRKSAEYGLPCESVTPAKRQRLIRTAYAYIAEKRLDANYRFDVIEVYHADGRVRQIRQISNAFEVEW